MKTAADAGDNPADAINVGAASATSTPAKTTPAKSMKSTPANVRRGISQGASKSQVIKVDSDGESGDEADYEEIDRSPSAHRSKVLAGRVSKNTPARASARATAAAASVAIAQTTALEQTASETEIDTPVNAAPAGPSLFGNVEPVEQKTVLREPVDSEMPREYQDATFAPIQHPEDEWLDENELEDYPRIADNMISGADAMDQYMGANDGEI